MLTFILGWHQHIDVLWLLGDLIFFIHYMPSHAEGMLSPALQGVGGWVGGREEERGGQGWGSGEGGGKTPQVKTRGHQSPPDGPDHPTRPKGHHSGRGH